MYGYFLELKNEYTLEEIYNKIEHTEISKLDVDRIYRFIDSYTSNEDSSEINFSENLE